MRLGRVLFLSAAFMLTMSIFAADKKYNVKSPDKRLSLTVSVGSGISYSLYDGEECLLKDSKIGMTFSDKGDISKNAVVSKKSEKKISEKIDAFLYKNKVVENNCNELTLKLKSGVNVTFRLYDTGMAYRFSVDKADGQYFVENEKAEFNFAEDGMAWLPYSTNAKKQMAMAFQATYDKAKLSESKDTLAFLPATVDCGNAKVTILESDLESYPGMFIEGKAKSLNGVFAQYPKTTDFYPWRKQEYVTSTENYIAKCEGKRFFPWRVAVVTRNDTEMPVNDLVYALASPNRIGDTSWIKPGKVAWDWWNDWGLSGVDFKAGINMDTYKYYIDFAAKHGLEYIVLDEGWYVPKSGDMLTTIPEINLPELVAYGKEKNVGIILWTVFNVLDSQLEEICSKYEAMGIKGFKVDFLDRDDQQGIDMIYRIADVCAKHHLVLDYHGIYKPTGINRTYPNIINFESVFGMEEAKWSKADEKDMPLYDVTFPFIRMMAGYVDFTPGGMRNSSKKDFQPIYYNPLTMGTRCHQLAMYIIHDSPLTMLADNPTAYEKEPECTSFIASLPTVFEKMIVPQGKLGEYIVTAREEAGNWYVGGQTNWDARDLNLSFDFLPVGETFEAVIFTDGINADKAATDYKVETKQITSETKMDVHLASGGGFAIKLIKK